MNVFFFLNYYSSFKNIIKKKKLIETGNISLIKNIKKISKNNNTTLILFDKNLEIKNNKFSYHYFDNIKFYIVPFKISLRNTLSLSLLYSLTFLLKLILFSNKSTFYIDRGNILIAFLIKVFSSHRVVLRILGITKQIEISVKYKSIRCFINKIFWKKKYDLVIHSNDGSNFKKFDNQYLNSKNKTLILNQAVENKKFKIKLNKNSFIILLSDNFSSEYKNLDQILKSFRNLDINIKSKIVLYIIYSSVVEKNKIKKKLFNFKNVILKKRTDHLSLLRLKTKCDAIVTFNSMGYLSNNIVESIFCRNWIITPEYPNNLKNIPKNFLENYIFLNKKNLGISLNNKLRKLVNNKGKSKPKFKSIYSIENKVNKEFKLLREMKLIN